ncbi:MAG: hypothetical protein H0V27_02865 [Pyrinomonadaceae bacterium]|nr:hypothetical protein [Pyrinomonadaceae bacterium]
MSERRMINNPPTRPRLHTSTASDRRGIIAFPARRHRVASTFAYFAFACALSALLFFAFWGTLWAAGDDSPWLPSGLVAGLVLLVAVAMREVVMRRAETRLVLERGIGRGGQTSGKPRRSTAVARLRALERRLTEGYTMNALPPTHLEAYRWCEDYLSNADEALRRVGVTTEIKAALRAGEERVRVLQKQHLLAWARKETQRLTGKAQGRERTSSKVETAGEALAVLDRAIERYPEEAELRDSALVVREYISSVKINHWIELAERAAFKGKRAQAVERYQDALYYLTRAEMSEEMRRETAERITAEINSINALGTIDESDVDEAFFKLEAETNQNNAQ